jgi:hypothetical protein
MPANRKKKKKQKSLSSYIANGTANGAAFGFIIGSPLGAALQGIVIGRDNVFDYVIQRPVYETMYKKPEHIVSVIGASFSTGMIFAAFFGGAGFVVGTMQAGVVGIERGIDYVIKEEPDNDKFSVLEEKEEKPVAKASSGWSKRSILLATTIGLGFCFFAKHQIDKALDYPYQSPSNRR